MLAVLGLLNNLIEVRHQLATLGWDKTVTWLDGWLDQLVWSGGGDWDMLDLLTAVLGRLYYQTPAHQRAVVFQDYRTIRPYLPKTLSALRAEVRYFCETVEPLILQAAAPLASL